MNNGAWQSARKRAATKYLERFGRQAPWGFEHLRIHDLKHTFGRRLRAARVPFETRQVLLGHKNGSITTHYSGAEIGELIEGVNQIDASRIDSGADHVARSVRSTRFRGFCNGKSVAKRCREKTQATETWPKSLIFWRGRRDSNPLPLGS